jgi:hypothetical protein
MNIIEELNKLREWNRQHTTSQEKQNHCRYDVEKSLYPQSKETTLLNSEYSLSSQRTI